MKMAPPDFSPKPNKAVDTAIAGGENDSRGGRKGFLFFYFFLKKKFKQVLFLY